MSENYLRGASRHYSNCAYQYSLCLCVNIYVCVLVCVCGCACGMIEYVCFVCLYVKKCYCTVAKIQMQNMQYY